MIDSHTHLYASQFENDRLNVVDIALKNGVKKFIIPNVDKDSYNPMIELCNIYKNICFPAIGLHPTSVEADYKDVISFFKKKANSQTFKAVGEIGIDCYWSLDFLEQQKDAFKIQVEWAKELDLPIIIHARESFHEIFPILDTLHDAKCRGVFHSFAGTFSDYEKIKEYGNFLVGIGGIVTFKNSVLAEVVARIDMKDIILETDSPYLAPHPFRGKRNESSYIIEIGKKIAEIKGLSLSEVDEITTLNAETLFNI